MEIENKFERYPEDHPIKIIQNSEGVFSQAYYIYLENTLNKIKDVNITAYNDFINNKLLAKSKDTFEIHSILSSMCELTIINSFLEVSDQIESFTYEPKLRKDNNKNVEFSINIGKFRYNVEVKSPNFENYKKKFNKLLKENGTVMTFESRFLPLTDDIIKTVMTSTDSKVKDFLVDSNEKFTPIDEKEKNEVNILFICWDENMDQPCTGLKKSYHGLLTSNSWYRNEDGDRYEFKNIDYIFISDLYKNHIVAMSSVDNPIPSIISGVPFFERNLMGQVEGVQAIRRPNAIGFIQNPFLLPFSRNFLIEPLLLNKDELLEVPVAFGYQGIEIVTEQFVDKYCIEGKINF